MALFGRRKKAEEAESLGTAPTEDPLLMPSDAMRMKAQGDVAGLIEVVLMRTTIAAQPAAVYLGELGDKSAVEALCKALDWPFTARSAAEALGRIGDPRAVEALTRALHHTDYWVQQEAANALAKLGPDGESALLTAADEDDPSIRLHIMEAMGDCQSDQTMDALLQGVKDDDDGVRHAAARSLNRREESPGVPKKPTTAAARSVGEPAPVSSPVSPETLDARKTQARSVNEEIGNFRALVARHSDLLARLAPVPEDTARRYFARVGIDQPNRYEDVVNAFSGYRQYAIGADEAPVVVSYLALDSDSATKDFLYVHLDDVPALGFLVCALTEGGFLGHYKTGTALKEALGI